MTSQYFADYILGSFSNLLSKFINFGSILVFVFLFIIYCFNLKFNQTLQISLKGNFPNEILSQV